MPVKQFYLSMRFLFPHNIECMKKGYSCPSYSCSQIPGSCRFRSSWTSGHRPGCHYPQWPRCRWAHSDRSSPSPIVCSSDCSSWLSGQSQTFLPQNWQLPSHLGHQRSSLQTPHQSEIYLNNSGCKKMWVFIIKEVPRWQLFHSLVAVRIVFHFAVLQQRFQELFLNQATYFKLQIHGFKSGGSFKRPDPIVLRHLHNRRGDGGCLPDEVAHIKGLEVETVKCDNMSYDLTFKSSS